MIMNNMSKEDLPPLATTEIEKIYDDMAGLGCVPNIHTILRLLKQLKDSQDRLAVEKKKVSNLRKLMKAKNEGKW